MKSVKRAALQLGTFIVLMLPFSVVQAQKGVHFEDLTFDQAMAKAKKTGKIIFVDVERMNPSAQSEQAEKEVLSIDSVSRFFKEHCISIKMNMGSEEGKKFAPRLAMLMYPVYVFHDSNGEQLGFISPGAVTKTPSLLMAKARESLATAKVKMKNKRSITFSKSKWSDLLALAKKENKMIFLDAYTEWCRPCIQMARDVFTLDKVADFYNEKFINVSMDMEKGEGPEINKRYEIRAYPAFLFIDGSGKLIYREGGYKEAEPFLKVGEEALLKFMAPKEATTAFVRPVRLTAPGTTSKAAAPAAAPAKVAPSAINFSEASWSNLLAEAKKSDKLIFVDAHTTWCGPCKMMRATVFTRKEVGDLFNRNFVNAYIDMEKGEGIDLQTRYNVRAYPTFLYINGDGEVVHRVVGSSSTEEFMQHSLDALSPFNNLRYLNAEYAKKAKDPAFIATYLKALENAYEQKKTNEIALTYLNGLDAVQWEQPDNWALIDKYVKDASSPVFNYLVQHQSRFEKLYGDKVGDKIYNTYLAWPINYLEFSKEHAPRFDEAGYQAFLAQVAGSDYARKAEILAKSKLTVYGALGNWDQYVATVNEMLAAKLVPMNRRGAEDLYLYANRINSAAKAEKNALKAATGWIKVSAEDIAEVTVLDKATYKELYATLLEKTGKKKQADKVRASINKEELKEAQDSSPMKMLRMK